MNLSNELIYVLAEKMNSAFENYSEYIPGKINFYIQKNKNILTALATEVEMARTNIITHYGEPSKDNFEQYVISQDNIPKAQQELEELLTIQQEVDIKKIKLKDIENINFTPAQMESLMFMIDEEEEEYFDDEE